MDKDFLGEMMRRSVPVATQEMPEGDGSGVFGNNLPAIVEIMSLAVMTSYKSRNDKKIDIYGKILEHTKEYTEGFRFFGSGGLLYDQYGRLSSDEQTELDLVEVIFNNEYFNTDKFETDQIWIPPAQRTQPALFKKLAGEGFPIIGGKQYLNAMGFVVDIVETVYPSPDATPIFRDSHGFEYDHLGKVTSDGPSMFDLAYHCMKNRGAAQDLTSKDTRDLVPELFNPMAPNEEAIKGEFYKHLLEANSLAKTLGWQFTFYLSTDL